MAQFQGFVVPVNQFIHDRVTELVSFMGMFDQLNFSTLPASGQLRLAGRIWGGPAGRHIFRVDVADDAGRVAGRSEDHQFETMEHGAVQHTYGIEVVMQAEQAGVYQAKLYVDNEEVATHPVLLRQG